MKISPRSLKMAGVLQEVLPEIIRQKCDPDEVGFVTITAVEVSGDLSVVDVYIRIIGGPKTAFAKLRRKAGIIAQMMARKVEMRRVPELRFQSDKSVHHYENIKKDL